MPSGLRRRVERLERDLVAYGRVDPDWQAWLDEHRGGPDLRIKELLDDPQVCQLVWLAYMRGFARGKVGRGDS